MLKKIFIISYLKVERGQALLEVAIVLPLLLLLILGAMDFGRLFSTKIVLTNVAREAAYYITLDPPENPDNYYDDSYVNTRQLVQDEAQNQGITLSESDIQFTNCCSTGNAVTVTVAKRANLIFVSLFKNLGITDGPPIITSSVQMMIP